MPEADRIAIKRHIVTLMLSSTNRVVQKQLSTALGVISDTDFPEKWDTLLPVESRIVFVLFVGQLLFFLKKNNNNNNNNIYFIVLRRK